MYGCVWCSVCQVFVWELDHECTLCIQSLSKSIIRSLDLNTCINICIILKFGICIYNHKGQHFRSSDRA